MGQRFQIRTGTVDELGEASVRFVNVALDDRGRPVSVLAVFDDGDIRLEVGQTFSRDGHEYAIVQIKRAGEAFDVIVDGPDQTPPKRRSLAQRSELFELPRSIDAEAFRDALRETTPHILKALGGDAAAELDTFMPIEWASNHSLDTTRDWTGEEWGPSHHWSAEARFENSGKSIADAGAGSLWANVQFSDIRYSADTSYRFEVQGHWSNGGRRASLFARADVPAPITGFYAAKQSAFLHPLLVDLLS